MRCLLAAALVLGCLSVVGLGQDDIADIEELSLEEIEVVEDGHGRLLGVSKHEWLEFTGPTIWVLLVLAILTRWVKPAGKARLMLQLHKTLAYLALAVGTLHGSIALFL